MCVWGGGGGGGGTGFSHPDPEGGEQSFVVVLGVFEVLTILEGHHNRFPPFKRGGVKRFTLS